MVTISVGVIYLIKSLTNAVALNKTGFIFILAHTFLVAVFLIYSCLIARVDEISYRYEYGFGWMFYFIIALDIISTVLAILLKFGKFSEVRKAPVVTATVQQDIPIDKIKEYKELLDSGIITQEEFDEKKKQILGL